MKVKFANKIYEVLYTKKVAEKTMYAVEDEPNHIDWLVNVEVIDEESEDKQIRKELIDYLKERKSCESYGQYVLRYNRWINWLEKQEASNPYSGVSFEYNGHTWGICARDNGVEILVDGAIKERVSLDDKPQGKADGECKAKRDAEHKVGKYFTGLIPCWVNAPSTLQPAHNYHGKNLVAIHLKDGGYRCCCIDDNKPITFTLPENTQLVEGWKRKSVEWSEEDKKQIERAIYMMEQLNMTKSWDDVYNWLKSLKPQPQWKPTDEQMEDLKYAINMVDKCCEDSLQSLYDELKKL